MFKGFGKNKKPGNQAATTTASYQSHQPPTTSSYSSAPTTTTTTTTMSSSPPKKYVKVNGVMKMNPEYKKWQAAQGGGGGPPQPAMNPQALPVVSNMDDHARLNEDLGMDVPLSESTNATIEMMQEPEFALEAGMQPDEMVDELGSILGKYEVPMGLMNKRE
jgi:hypothetical protein